jgi:tetratricopeptide (TPR) repeat protein
MIQRTRRRAAPRAILAAGFLLLPALLEGKEEGKAAANPEALIARIREAPAAERRRLAQDLAAAGPAALDATRKARDEAADPEVKEAFARAALWQLAAKVTPALEASIESQLTFDGQFAGLKEEGPEAPEALLALAEDAATAFPLRVTALHALADLAAREKDARPARLQERLRGLHHDVLAPERLRDQAGILLAILGDTQALDAEIGRLEKLAGSEDPRESVSSNIELSNLYYRIRSYEKAVKCYDRILRFYEQILDAQKRAGAPREVLDRIRRELGLHYYNAACSSSLAKDVAKTKSLIRKAVDLDPIHYSNMERDGDLANLRKDAEYPAFRRELGKPFEKAEF